MKYRNSHGVSTPDCAILLMCGCTKMTSNKFRKGIIMEWSENKRLSRKSHSELVSESDDLNLLQIENLSEGLSHRDSSIGIPAELSELRRNKFRLTKLDFKDDLLHQDKINI